MSLKQKIFEDFKVAFKQKDEEKKSVLSLVNSEIKNEEIKLGVREEGLSDEQVEAILRCAIKQRKDSIEQYIQGGRPELAEKEQKEVELLQGYLPEQMSAEKIEIQVKAAIEETGAEGASDLGRVMGVAMAKLKGKADGGEVRKAAQQLLGEK